VSLCFDANDPLRLARFWAATLLWEIHDESDEEIGLTLVHRRNKKSRSLRERLAARIAHARDSIQLERIWRKRNKQ